MIARLVIFLCRHQHSLLHTSVLPSPAHFRPRNPIAHLHHRCRTPEKPRTSVTLSSRESWTPPPYKRKRKQPVQQLSFPHPALKALQTTSWHLFLKNTKKKKFMATATVTSTRISDSIFVVTVPHPATAILDSILPRPTLVVRLVAQICQIRSSLSKSNNNFHLRPKYFFLSTLTS